ncbi:MAG: Gfo/Idh/MocA family oxidoreductase [Candidatus Competibacteraceae bacterium]|nr:Gfo/Idh/MocA family oxidoreductase [Candidatus Competibacteraceae bacterium]
MAPHRRRGHRRRGRPRRTVEERVLPHPRRAQGYGDYRELIADPEVELVDICLPNFLHAEVAVAALEAGKHVISEKPFATTLADGERVVEAAVTSGRRYFYAEDWIFAPALVRAGQILDSGGIGKPLYWRGKEAHNGSHSPFAQKVKFCGGGSLIHLGIHPIGYFYHRLGLPRRVTAVCSGGLEANLAHKRLEGEDFAIGVMSYDDGTQAVVEGNYVTRGGMHDVIEVYGEEGRLSVDLTFGSPLSVYSVSGIDYAIEKTDFTSGWTRPAVNEFQSLGYLDELRHFVDCLAGRRSRPWARGPRTGLRCCAS